VPSRPGVTALENPALRQLALKALAQRAGAAPGAAALAAAAQRAYDDLAQVSAPLIGQVGVDALTGRTLYLAQRKYPWLVHTREPEQWKGPFAQIVFCLERQDPAVATEAAGAVLTILTGLLVTFIGEPLTARLLRKAWPDAFSDASIEET
jgi:hypothetical protein